MKTFKIYVHNNTKKDGTEYCTYSTPTKKKSQGKIVYMPVAFHKDVKRPDCNSEISVVDGDFWVFDKEINNGETTKEIKTLYIKSISECKPLTSNNINDYFD